MYLNVLKKHIKVVWSYLVIRENEKKSVHFKSLPTSKLVMWLFDVMKL